MTQSAVPQGLGHLVELTEAHPEKTFLGGLDRSEKHTDGRFAIMWEDDLMQVQRIMW